MNLFKYHAVCTCNIPCVFELERVYLYSVRKGQTAIARARGLYELEKSRRRLYINKPAGHSVYMIYIHAPACIYNK